MSRDREVSVTVFYRGEGYRLDLPGGCIAARGELAADGTLLADLNGRRMSAAVVRHGGEMTVLLPGHSHSLRLRDPFDAAPDAEAAGGRLRAPMPGKIIQVRAAPGERVSRGQPLVVLEAMKMEHTIAAPGDGTVAAVYYRAGELVEEGAELIAFEADE